MSELSAAAQAKLLRVLQEKQFQPLGSSRVITTNARVIAATNRRLEDCIADGQFRKDLYYRLSVFPIYLPPLRDRGSDIILLADHFVIKYVKELGKQVKRYPPPSSRRFYRTHGRAMCGSLKTASSGLSCLQRANPLK